jgi:hypothetical protein
MFDVLVNVLTMAALMGLGGVVFVAVGMFVVGALGLRDD